METISIHKNKAKSSVGSRLTIENVIMDKEGKLSNFHRLKQKGNVKM
jgi:hypothetical protein